MSRMNLLNFILIFLLFPLVTFGQKDKDVRSKDVPQVVKDSLVKKFNPVTHLKYYKEVFKDKTLYEASFKYKEDIYNLTYFPDGSIYELEIEIKQNQIPEQVNTLILNDLALRYSKYKIRQIEIVNPENEKLYELSLHAKKGKHTGYFDVYYNENGTFHKEEEDVLNSIPSNSGF
jgi:hypothetical protein